MWISSLEETPAGPHPPVAISGASCRLPADINHAARLGHFLHTGQSAISDVPADRWSRDVHDPTGQRPGTTRSHRGSFLSNARAFDASFFNITADEANAMDPQQRILLEVGWEAMRMVEPSRQAWSGSRTGVYVGLLASDYRTLHIQQGHGKIGVHYATGNEASFAAGRLAFHLDLNGPALGVSTACSSSLVALTLAADAIRLGHIDTAVVCGISLLLSPELSIYMNTIGALSPTGECSPFTTAANGVVRGEGCAAVVLQAAEDASHPLALVRGYGTNHDGWSAGLTAPNPNAQTQLLKEVWDRAQVDPTHLDFLEMHGTGTPTGDPAEAAAVSAALQGTRDDNPLAIGSHKANFGHLDAAAGLVGLLKAMNIVRTGNRPPQPAGADPICLPDGLRLNITPDLHNPPRPRLAAVNAFGLSGTNAHVVLEQAATSSPLTPGTPHGWNHKDYWSQVLPPPTRLERLDPDSPPPRVEEFANQASTQHVVDSHVATALGVSDSDLPSPTDGLFESGLTSLNAVQLSQKLAQELAVDLPTTFVLEHPTRQALATALAERLADTSQTSEPATSNASTTPGADRNQSQTLDVPSVGPGTDGATSRFLAVTAYSYRLPGVANDAEVWNALTSGRPLAHEYPRDRPGNGIWETVPADVPRKASWLENIDAFDHTFFHISATEAKWIDPQHRISLEVAADCLIKSGHGTPTAFASTTTGVVAAVDSSDYAQLVSQDPAAIGAYYGPGCSPAAAAGRISYALNLQGPSITLDTACSSSLSAISIAQGLLNGDQCDQVLVVGANIGITPTIAASMHAAGALSPDGRCKPFDASADGYGRGDGVVALLLARYETAVASNERIHAVIESVALNQDGASGGFTVPSVDAQKAVIAQALDQAGRGPADPVAVEAHGTGTRLGDPLELRALQQSLSRTRVAIGASKTTFGHLEAAAGLLGVLKIILSFRAGYFPSQPIATSATSEFDWSTSRLTLHRDVDLHKAGTPVGLSSFGFTGANAHAILSSPMPSQSPSPALNAWVMPISGHTEEACRQQLERYQAAITSWSESDTAAAIYQLTHSPQHRYRRAISAPSAHDLASALQALHAPHCHIHDIHDIHDAQPADHDLADDSAPQMQQIVDDFHRGGHITWNVPRWQQHQQDVTYPFTPARHWYEPAAGLQAAQTGGAYEAATKAQPPSPPSSATPVPLDLRDISSPSKSQILNTVIKVTAAALEAPLSAVQPDSGFFDLGLDSMLSVRVCAELSEHYDLELDPAAAFEFPTPTDFADHIRDQYLTRTVPPPITDRDALAPTSDESCHNQPDSEDPLAAALTRASSLLTHERETHEHT